MATLFSDDFSVSGDSLGAGWTEDSGDFQVASGNAQLEATGNSFATVDTSSAANSFVQCWINIPDSSNNGGVIFRYISATEYYQLIGQPTVGLRLFVRDGGFTVLDTAGSIGGGDWHLITVRMVGDLIHVYLDQGYTDSKEGPLMAITNSVHTGQSGKVGIVSSGNNATGASGPQWNDFHCFDGTGSTIYLDASTSGGGLGTESSPLPGIGFALNSGTLRTSGETTTLKILNDSGTPIGNGAYSGAYKIGHAGAYAGAGTFPTFNKLTGAVISQGSPNLVIEGAGSASRTLLRESQNRAYFTVRCDATYVQILNLDFDMTGGAASKLVSTISTNQIGASTEHSVAIDKCSIELATAAVNDQSGVGLSYDWDDFKLRFCYLTVRSGGQGSEWVRLGAASEAAGDTEILFNVMTGEVRRGIRALAGVAAGKTLDVDHNHFVNLNSPSFTVACLEVADGAKVQGTCTFQNNLAYTTGANKTEFGVNLVTGAVSGTLEAHHNGYSGIVTPRDTGVSNAGNETVQDPSFNDVNSTFPWAGSGSSPTIVLDADWRPTASGYINTADDTSGGEQLDRGALQGLTQEEISPPSPITEAEWITLLGRKGFMADTVDVLGRIRYKQSGQEEDKVEGELTGRTVTHFLRNFIILSTNTTNTQIAFGASFTTAIYGVLKSHVGTFTYSRSTNTRHHLVNEGGFAFWVGDSSSLFVSNNSTTTPAQIEIVLAGS